MPVVIHIRPQLCPKHGGSILNGDRDVNKWGLRVINRERYSHKHVKNHTGLYMAVGGDRMGCNHMNRMGQVNRPVHQMI